ncbi:hypothetical protein NE235_02350 [Actinoallomurus spadix]|uniref:hypothetical protein n=1 Tax=Actinoallomurus spadix TaxID=79912 RepID=UPI002092908C|nr:hypothetical protein [Actinoallomurus spadix]MCO5984943.1 hypothetical protein [Actinoallomurus spadix]
MKALHTVRAAGHVVVGEVLLAASPLVEGVTGRYFEDCQEAEPHRPGVRRGVADHALDSSKAARLWRLSLDLSAAAERPS